MPPLSPVMQQMRGAAAAWSVGDRAVERMRDGADIIHLGIGDPDLDTPAAIRRALTQAVEEGRTHYSPLAGEPGTRAAIAAHAERLYDVPVSPDAVAVGGGAQGALFAAMLAVAAPGDEVIILEPYYASYPAVVAGCGAVPVPVPLDPKTGYALDIARIEAAASPRTVAVLINSPGNPSGTVFAQEDLDALVRWCRTRGLWLLSDEVYWALTYDTTHASPLCSPDAGSHTIVINSLSKSHAMTGWRLGWSIGPPDLVAAIADLSQALHFGICQFVQEAAITALADTRSVMHHRSLFHRRRDVLIDGLLASSKLGVPRPEGGMFVLVDVSATGLDGAAFAERLLDEAGVAVVPGFGFGQSVGHSVRVGFLCDEDRLADAARRIVRFADRLS
ncbi:MAG: aminotransferase class I/II-fold pyridoxal phosphate-dependent enzyme [Pseudomonadota bacterium]